MLTRLPRWCRARWKRLLAAKLAAAVAALNLVAYMQAHALTHYAAGGAATYRPERLSRWQKGVVVLTGVTVPRPENVDTPADHGLTFTTHRFPSSGGATLEAWHVPSAAPRGTVLVFHGHAGCKGRLMREIVAFHRLGYDVLAVDFRGSGGSSDAVSTIGVREADDVAAAVEFVRGRWAGRPVVLFGQSMGAAAVLRAAAVLGVTADAIVLECPFDHLLTTVGHRFDAMGLPAFPLAHLLVFWGGVQHGFDAFAHNPADYAARVTVPTLLMHGARDSRVHTAESRAVYERLAGPKRFEVFEECGHHSYVGKCPGPWAGVVKEFLDHHVQ
jgi:alpha-beta hydrolase superfamily lysophospholipase